jgi:5'-nucleotidase
MLKLCAVLVYPANFVKVIADFDATLTRYRVNGLRGRQTSHGLLQQGDAYYDAKRQALYDHYHPLEISPVIPIDEKTKLMEEWYILLFLSITFGLSFDTLVWTNK